jgi:hypothetical protein
MPKTYNTFTNVSVGSVLTASDYNETLENIGNYRVPPMARIRLTSDVSVANSDADSFAGFTSTNAAEDIDTDGMVTLSATASAITIQTAGVYSCHVNVRFQGGSNGVRQTRLVRSRSGTLSPIAAEIGIHAAGNATNHSCSGVIECQAGDLIRVVVFQTNGAPLNIEAGDANTGTSLAAAWLGQAS